MKYLLDTNIIVDHLRGRQAIKPEILESGAVISIITLGELLYGAHKSESPKDSLNKLRDVLEILDLAILNLDTEIVGVFGEIKVRLERLGTRLEDFDLLIAATVKVFDLTLVTRNMRHFERISELKLK